MFKQIVLSGAIGFTTLLYANINVVVSILPQEEFVEKIGGDRVDVTTMVQPGSNPHSYEPKASQMRALSKADIYFPIGIEFEKAWLGKFAQHNKEMKFVETTTGITPLQMVAHTHSHKHSHHTADETSATPFEWAGAFALDKGEYRWSFAKVDGEYADPSMRFLMMEVEEGVTQNPIKKYEKQATRRFLEEALDVENEKVLDVKRGLYRLHFDETKEQTFFTLNIKKSGTYLFFTQHFPFEFEDKEHFLKDMSQNDIEAFVTQPEAEGNIDPHTWTSPQNVKIMALNIYKTLASADRQNATYYENNYENFLKEIEYTDTKIKGLLGGLEKGSKFMVFHPSWGYFAREYGLVQLPIEVEGKEPKPKTLAKIIKKAKEQDVKAIFAQKEFSDKSARAIASELDIEVIKETPLAKEWSKNLLKMAGAIANNK
ncbi:MAG: zinc ABC transporter substrate-binding protein [Campylobacterota bacterium]|nr:zinc ABC transporter substrate-binding protein [Campylobacterota bacterium]